MGGVLLDTTALIDVLRGREAIGRLRRLRTTGDMPFVCAINIEEVVRGLRQGEESSAHRLVEGRSAGSARRRRRLEGGRMAP